MRAAPGKYKQSQFWAVVGVVPAGGMSSCGAEAERRCSGHAGSERRPAAVGRGEVQRGPGRDERGCDVTDKLPLVQTASEPARGVVAPVVPCSWWLCCSGMMVLEGVSFPVN